MTRWFEKFRQRISSSNKGKPNKPRGLSLNRIL